MMRIELISVVVAVTTEVDDIAAAYRSYRPVLAPLRQAARVHLRRWTGRCHGPTRRCGRSRPPASRSRSCRFATPFGEAAALTVGFRHAAGDVVFTLTPRGRGGARRPAAARSRRSMAATWWWPGVSSAPGSSRRVSASSTARSTPCSAPRCRTSAAACGRCGPRWPRS